MGFLYLVRCNEFVKIGIAQDVSDRLATLQTGNPYPLTLLDSFEFPNALQVESGLHKKFKKFLVQGEWLKFNDEQVEQATEICQNYDKQGIAFDVGTVSDVAFAAATLQSALSYCIEAGLHVEFGEH